MSKSIITLEDFGVAGLELLANWLEQPHVRPWYPDPIEDLENARRLCVKPIERNPESGQFLIAANRQAVGYLRWQLVSEELLSEIGLTGIPGNSADVDLLIGERSHICRGLGATVLAEIESLLRARGNIPAVGLTTNKGNRFAHRAFEKSGYSVAAEYTPDGYGDCYLYMKRLDT